MARRVRLSGEGRDWVIDIGDADVTVAGVEHPFVVSAGDDGRYAVGAEADSLSCAAACDGDTVWVTVGSEVFEFRLIHGRAGASARDHDALTPPMSATVTRIAVKPGDTVRTGDLLVALEAMKMELPIRAPHDGVITAVNCREGDLVQPGQVLIDM
jgi:biotin carboxyl carrier protein